MKETVYIPATEKFLQLLTETEEAFNKQMKDLLEAVGREKNATLSNLVKGYLSDKIDTFEGASVTLEGENFVVVYTKAEPTNEEEPKN